MHVGWDAAAMGPTAFEQQWMPMQVKSEPRDIQHSEPFHSTESSSSRDSNPNSPQSMDSIESHHQQMPNAYYDPSAHYRMQSTNPMMQHQFNPLTPPNFDTPKLDRLLGAYHQHLSAAACLPLQAPTPPKSPSGILPETPELTANENSCGESEHSDDGPKDEGDNKHLNYDSGEDNDDLLSTPRINSHGKVKTFKCKQCDYVAVTKTDFWKHIEQHIKPEKRLYCPKCPFVTEYKHHQEYHLRNHTGSKPFQCNKCRYSCVNKSMLNSHKKSHSNVYQYRCADCNYVSKYCHSLKLHLKKYKHQPAMVLNQDGTPNPLQIIDVYGTRRGPKARPTPNRDDMPQQMSIQTTPVSRLQQLQQKEQQNLANVHQQQMFQNPFAGIPFPYGPLLTAFPGFQNLMFNNNNIEPMLSSGKTEQQPSEMLPRENQENQILPKPAEHEFMRTQLVQPPQKTPTQNIIIDEPVDMSPKRTAVTPVVSSPASTSAESALDLTRTTKDGSQSNNSTSKNRRKGKAFKLDRLATQSQYSSEDEDSSVTQSPVKVKVEEEPIRVEGEDEVAAASTKAPEVFECRYCEMVFKHEVLYTMHMGYHGYKDAFACNMCGERCGDRVSFFMHIARNPHV
ncbi:protein hunchback-like [Ctenocephalides felis]|uniref:protein hunchback-like n=1 Tax=Ctenocephalides felis TaxID=7515 RepID=UPI000E6E323D|nr:protein hunchback-like [Ctenocephalides felis]